MLKKLSFALCVAGLMTSGVAMAENATSNISVTFNGTILPEACTFSLNDNQQSTQTVALGSIRPVANSVGNMHALKFSLTECSVEGLLNVRPASATLNDNDVVPTNKGENGVGTATIGFYTDSNATGSWVLSNPRTIDKPADGEKSSHWTGYARLEGGTAPKSGSVSEVVEFVVTYQ